jgi:AcrR family transcriptional regulator
MPESNGRKQEQKAMRKRSGISGDEAAAALGRKGGLKGGVARARSLTAEQRSASARHAAAARWGNAVRPIAEESATGTREKIYRAARSEFLQRGFDGARVDRIVQQAGVNKRMLYHYFGSKEGLYRELMARNIGELRQHEAAAPESLGDSFEYWQQLMSRNPGWIRGSLLEALGSSTSPVAQSERAIFWREGVAAIREAQRRGEINSTLDAAHLQLALVALVMFPLLMPQFAELITGRKPDNAQFVSRQHQFLRALAVLLER